MGEMESEEWPPPPCPIPPRIFKYKDEPDGIRVTPYHKPGAIREILAALDPEEIVLIRLSPFGKLIEIAEKPSFSGRFGRYIFSRQLKTAKKYEAWFLFVGKPIRFSLREFALVTGLNCGKFPKDGKRRSKQKISTKPYWGELFGTMKDVYVVDVIKMLKKRTVTDRDQRVKIAFLALLSAVLLPTTHTPKISEDHAEMIKDIEVFLAYPWGRLSFQMVISSIKERKEVALSQSTIAVKGFVLALQLVMVEAVPALTEAVQDGTASDADGDVPEEPEIGDADDGDTKSINPGHARKTDSDGKADVISIIIDGESETNGTPEWEWSDEEEDTNVENMVSLIEQGYPFSQLSFTGGASKLDVMKMREEEKVKNRKSKQSTPTSPSVQIDAQLVASLVRDNVRPDFQLLQKEVRAIRESNRTFQAEVVSMISNMWGKLQADIMRIVSMPRVLPTPDLGHDNPSPSSPRTTHAGTQTEVDAPRIIEDAINFAANATANVNQGEKITPVAETNPDVVATAENIEQSPHEPVERMEECPTVHKYLPIFNLQYSDKRNFSLTKSSFRTLNFSLFRSSAFFDVK